MTLLVSRSPLTSSVAALPIEDRAFGVLEWLECEYPGFSDWYWTTVVPGISTGERRLATVERGGRVVGVGISKRTSSERKMCTIWVDQQFTGTGMGVRLMVDSMQWLGTSLPLATVSESRMNEFKPIMDRLGYKITQVLPNFYRPGHSEFVFNGSLKLNA